jgi:hypothetical protein
MAEPLVLTPRQRGLINSAARSVLAVDRDEFPIKQIRRHPNEET